MLGLNASAQLGPRSRSCAHLSVFPQSKRPRVAEIWLLHIMLEATAGIVLDCWTTSTIGIIGICEKAMANIDTAEHVW